MNAFKLTFIQADTNQERLAFSFETKKEANKKLNSLIKEGKVRKAGYEYHHTEYYNLELRLNY